MKNIPPAHGVELSEPFFGPDHWVSPFYWWPEVQRELSLPERVLIHDVTLRDGEQTARVVFTPEEKIFIARELDRLGVYSIEPGFPTTQEDRDVLRELVRLKLRARIVPIARVKVEDVRACLDSKPDGVVLEFTVNPFLMREVFDRDPDSVIDEVAEYAASCHDAGVYVEFMGWDVFRVPDRAYLQRFFTRLSERAPIDRLTIADTFGMGHPLATRAFVRMLRRWTDKPIGFHIHNDFGLATADSLMAIAAGADMIHSSVNGLGERAGNVATEQVCMALQHLCGLDLGIDLARLKSLSDVVEEISKVPRARNQPIVGDGLFDVESGIVVHLIDSLAKTPLGGEVFFPFPPGVAGHPSWQVLAGRGSGKRSMQIFIDTLGLRADEQQTERIVARVKQAALALKNALPQTLVESIIREELSAAR